MRARLAALALVLLVAAPASAQLKIAGTSASASADAVVDRIDAGSGPGTLTIFGSVCPDDADDADSGTVLAILTFADPAFGSASGGTATANSITADSSANNTGTARCFRAKDSDGNVVFQGSITTAGNGGDLILSSTSVTAGQSVAITALTYTQPEEPAYIAAASCSETDVQAAVDAAVDGQAVVIPAGNCTWSTGITVADDMGITLKGTGTPSSSASTIGPGSCTSTEITLTGATAFRATPTYGNAKTRLSCMEIIDGSGANIALSVLGTCTSSGCPNLRMDNITFTDWAPHAVNGIGYSPNVVGDVFGVIDHNLLSGTAGTYLQLVQFSHASYMGVGSYGDNSWSQPEDYGTGQFLYIENNQFDISGATEFEGTAGNLTNAGGGRVVVRYNTFSTMDSLNLALAWHGTESYGRPRGVRAFEFYGNTWTCATHCGDVADGRSGTGMVWGNTVNHPSGVYNSFFKLTTYRALQSIGGWGPCDGSGAYDSNEGVTHYSGTIASVSGSNPYVITVSGSPGWSANQWVSAGTPYSVHDVDLDDGSEITASGTNTLTVRAWTSIAYATGHTIQILRAFACLDQAGGRGAGTLYGSDPASPASTSDQDISPTYVFANALNNSAPNFGTEGVTPNTARVVRNRDFYVETINQAAQSSASSPFDGTTTIGAGHGIIARRPTTCTTGVSYWATDEGTWDTSGLGRTGRLYLCTSTNTWTLSYTPYTYPHPLM
jgi:hypothetical protein